LQNRTNSLTFFLSLSLSLPFLLSHATHDTVRSLLIFLSLPFFSVWSAVSETATCRIFQLLGVPPLPLSTFGVCTHTCKKESKEKCAALADGLGFNDPGRVIELGTSKTKAYVFVCVCVQLRCSVIRKFWLQTSHIGMPRTFFGLPTRNRRNGSMARSPSRIRFVSNGEAEERLHISALEKRIMMVPHAS